MWKYLLIIVISISNIHKNKIGDSQMYKSIKWTFAKWFVIVV